jgi:nucleoid-associated protein YgaU
MKKIRTTALCMTLALGLSADEVPKIPAAGEATAYLRLQPVFKESSIPRERGDALLKALDEGRAVEKWMKNGFPPGVVCVLPIPPSVRFAVIRQGQKPYEVGLSFEGGLVYLPDGLFEVRGSVQKEVARLVRELELDLKHELTAATKPLTYTVGTVNDNGTLSGVARLFYGDAAKWKRIYEANRATIKNPNVIQSGMKLVIPTDEPKPTSPIK